MSLLSLPNEILLQVAKYIARKDDIYSLLKTNRRLSILISPRFLKFACSSQYCVTALFLAAANRDENMIRLLLDEGHSMKIQYNPPEDSLPSVALPEMIQGENLISLVGLSSDEKEIVVKYLLEKGADSIIFLEEQRQTALLVAVLSRNLVRTRILLSRGAKATSFDHLYHGFGLLHYPVYSKNLPMVKLLVEGGIDTESYSSTGVYETCITPLFLAAEGRAWDIVTYLAGVGADINIPRAPHGRILLHWMLTHIGVCQTRSLQCSWYKEALEMIRLLLELGADPNIRSKYGGTALDIARFYKIEHAYTLLESYGAVDELEIK